MQLLFFLISVVSVSWFLDLTVVDLLPSSNPFTRCRFKSLQRAGKFAAIRPPIHLSGHFSRAAEV